MGRILLFTALAAVAGGLLAVSGTARTSGDGVPAPAAFRLLDGSAGCVFEGERIACRAQGTPRAVVLQADGESFTDDVDVAWDDRTPVLRRTESWWHGAFSCGVDDDSSLACTAENGSIAVGRSGVGGASSAFMP